MELLEFEEQTTIFARNQPEYKPLPAHVFSDGRIACCWGLSFMERFRILIFGKVWHQVLTHGRPLQPQLLTTEKPEMEMNE